MSAVHGLLLPLTLLVLHASPGHAACVEVDSDTEAVVNQGFKLGCISCKMRAEVKATATVNWYFNSSTDSSFLHIYSYENKVGEIMDPEFDGRLTWQGSNNTDDVLDGSIYILNVTFNDSGLYTCVFDRTIKYTNYENRNFTVKLIDLKVLPQFTRGLASILSEVMMYVAIVGLQLWLAVEMIYCFRKISAAGEKALRESAEEYLTEASDSKEDCASVQVAE